VESNASAFQRAPDAQALLGYTDTNIPNCSQGTSSTGIPSTAASAVSCVYRTAALQGTASAAFGGPLRLTGGLAGGLDNQPPGFDRLTAVAATAGWRDEVVLGNPAAGAATFSLFARVTGTSVVRDLSSGDGSYTQGFVGLTTPGLPNVPFPWGDPSPYAAYVNLESSGPQLVRTTGRATFDGTHSSSVAGVTNTVTTDGWVTFDNLPVLPGSTMFFLRMGFVAVLFNDTTAPKDVLDEVMFDYGNSLTIGGIRVFDAAGNDVTAAAQPTFRSGGNLNLGDPRVVPEPSTVLLMVTGLVGLLVGARRARIRRA
jgi:hypothetical protein